MEESGLNKASGSPAADILALEEELQLVRARLEQREAALGELNRRLRSLEQRSSDVDARPRSIATDRRTEDLERELQALYQTKTFRYTQRLRRVYSLVRAR